MHLAQDHKGEGLDFMTEAAYDPIRDQKLVDARHRTHFFVCEEARHFIVYGELPDGKSYVYATRVPRKGERTFRGRLFSTQSRAEAYHFTKNQLEHARTDGGLQLSIHKVIRNNSRRFNDPMACTDVTRIIPTHSGVQLVHLRELRHGALFYVDAVHLDFLHPHVAPQGGVSLVEPQIYDKQADAAQYVDRMSRLSS